MAPRLRVQVSQLCSTTVATNPENRISDHHNGAPGGEEAHGNFIDCMMKTIETSASSAVKDQAAGVGHGVKNQLEVVVGNQPKAAEQVADKVAEVKPKGDGADLSKRPWPSL
jgi:hypothetical protein